jgi:hypothetical protein
MYCRLLSSRDTCYGWANTRCKIIMKNKISLFVSIIFFFSYGILNTIGSIFLVSFGGQSLYKKIIVFMGTFPIDWFKLSVEKSFIFTILNVIFWTSIVYLCTTLLINFFKKILS